MRTRTFAGFVAPSVLSMVLLIALPLLGVAYLALHNSYVRTSLVEIKTEVPVFGGIKKTLVKTVPQPVLDDNGQPIRVWEYTGSQKLQEAADVDGLATTFAKSRDSVSLPEAIASMYGEITNFDFWGALEFTLIYTFVTTPFVLLFGLMLALSVDRVTSRFKGALISTISLPMIITPVVSALALYWLFLDNAILAGMLEELGFGHIYFLKDSLTIRSLIVFYGVWNAAPFAFIILYAGLQTVPREPLEAAMVDGASAFQRLRLVIIPHLMPLFIVITLIHLMDSYRVFEPILVFGSSVYASSLQYLIYYTLRYEDNIHLAAAHALLTVAGIVILLIPVLVRTWREQRVL